jgi:beta-lactam-binding protein with PASTA domain
MAIGDRLRGQPGLTRMPPLIGVTVTHAVDVLEAIGLVIAVDHQRNQDVPAGHVFGVSPPAGAKVPEGMVITVLVAVGLVDHEPFDD